MQTTTKLTEDEVKRLYPNIMELLSGAQWRQHLMFYHENREGREYLRVTQMRSTEIKVNCNGSA